VTGLQAVLSAETSYTNSNLDKIVEWVKMLNSASSVDQQIALASLVDSSLDKRDLANFLAMDGVSALMKIMSYGTPSSKGFVVRVMWLHLLDFPEGRVRAGRVSSSVALTALHALTATDAIDVSTAVAAVGGHPCQWAASSVRTDMQRRGPV
jgi:hypothetical protein